MDKLFNFSLESALLALTNTEEVRSLLNASLPYLEKHRTILTDCLEEDNCVGVEDLIGNIGKMLCSFYSLMLFLQVTLLPIVKHKNQDTVTVQAFYLSNPHKLMDIRQSGPLLKAAAHTGQCTPTHLHKSGGGHLHTTYNTNMAISKSDMADMGNR